FQEQLHARAEGGDAGNIEGTALPAAGVRFEPKIDARKIPRIHNAVPANPNRMQEIDQVAANVENAGPLRPQQPFVSVRREKIDRRLPHIDGKNAQPLNGIDKEIDAALPAQTADGIQIVAKAAGKLDHAEADKAGALVDGFYQLI